MPYVAARCVEGDRQNKLVAAEYRRSARLIKRRIDELHGELKALEKIYPSKHRRKDTTLHTTVTEIHERLKILNDMYRTTSAIGREAEHYYEWDWWRSEIYTLNTRKRG